MAHVIGHVRRQDHPNDALPKHFLLLHGVPFRPVVLLLAHNSHRLSRVVILLHRLIVVTECPVSHEVDMVSVVKAIMVVVVAGRCNNCRDKVNVIQLGHLSKIALLNIQEHHLSDVCAVKIIMVLDVLPVSHPDRAQEVDQFVLVDNADDGLARKLPQDVEDGEREGVLASQFLTHLEAVEVKAIDLLQDYIVQFNHRVEARLFL